MNDNHVLRDALCRLMSVRGPFDGLGAGLQGLVGRSGRQRVLALVLGALVMLVVLAMGLVPSAWAASSSGVSSSGASSSGDSLATDHGRRIIRVGVVISKTGPLAEASRPMVQALNLADQRISNAGGVLINGIRYDLQLVYMDDMSDAEHAKMATKALAKDPHIMALIGPYSSDTVLAVRDAAEHIGIPVINAAGAAPQLQQVQDVQWLFGIGASAGSYFSPLIELAARRLAGGQSFSVGLAYQDDLFGEAIKQGVLNDLRSQGVPLAFETAITSGSEIGPLLAQVEKQKPTLFIFSANNTRLSRTLVSGIAERRVNINMLALSGCRVADLSALGEAAEYTLCPAQWDGLSGFSDPYWGTSTHFLSAFEVAYGNEPPDQAAQAAAALEVIAQALPQVTGTITRAKLRHVLTQVDVSTVFGDVRFGPNGRNEAVHPLLEQIRGGGYLTVLPPDRAWVPLVAKMPPWEDREP